MKLVFNELFLFLIIINGFFGQDLVELTNCPGNRILPFTPSESVIIKPIWQEPNRSLLNNYIWTYDLSYKNHRNTVNPPKYDTKSWYSSEDHQFVIPKYTLIPNIYNLTVTSTRSPSATTGPPSPFTNGHKTCYFLTKSYKPYPIIAGGYERVVPVGTDFVMDGEESFDRNFGSFSRDNLKFRWSCTQKLSPGSVCKGDTDVKKFTVKGASFRVGEIVHYTLEVSLSYLDDKISASVTQTIFIRANAALLDIHCRKNCVPWTPFANYEMETIIGVSCVSNCTGIKDDDYVWNVEHPNEKYYVFNFKSSRYGKTGKIFFLEKNAFSARWYIIKVSTNSTAGVDGYASLKISFQRAPGIRDCKINPPEGVSQTTRFTFSCTQEPPNEPYHYQLIRRNVNDFTLKNVITAGPYPDVFNLAFTLPPSEGNEFILKIERVESEPYPAKEIKLVVNVKSFLDTVLANDTTDILKTFSELVSSPDQLERSTARQIFENLIEELIVSKIENEEIASFVENLKFSAAEDMLKAPLESLDEIEQLSSTLTQLQEINAAPESDPLLAKFTTTVCKKMADRSLDLVKEEQYPLYMEDSVHNLSKTLISCFEVNLNPNLDVIRPIVLNVTTEAAIFEGPMLTESYPNYVDFDEEYYKTQENLKEASDNIIQGSSTTGKTIALTTAIGEGVIRVPGKSSETLVLKDLGLEFAKTTINPEGILLIPSKDFENDRHSYDLLMTIWKKDIFWWNPAGVKVDTNIINVNFWHSTCKKRIENFLKPVNIFFDLKRQNFVFEALRDSINIPQGYGSMSDSDLNYEIKVYRITLAKGRTLHVNFVNLTSSDIFDVVLTENKFPTVEDFEHKTTMKLGMNGSLTLINNLDIQIHAYVGILANKEVESKILSYAIATYEKFCVKWVTLSNEWVPACRPGQESNDSVIQCQCTQFSVLAGYVQNVEPHPQEVLREELELRLTSCPIIFITTATTIGIISLLMIFSLIKKKDQLYYLADNNISHRFVYLIVVKTGLLLNSGTSSNIVVKLIGEKNTSEPHVLNYPDPQSRILQQFGKDLFILTTEHHLGNIRKMELWFDCTGQNPSWFCRDITVLDLQKYTEWYFHVRKKVSLIRGSTHLELTPTHGNKQESKVFNAAKCRFILSPKHHNWYLWEHEPTFSYLKKLTVILSNVLTNYALVLIFIGLPRFEMRDSLDERRHHRVNVFDIYVALLSSFVTFMVHIAIAWIFRFSPIQFSHYEQNVKLTFRYTQACWYILISMITVSTAFLTMSGFWVPQIKSLVWLTICAIGVTFGVIVYESIFVCIAKYFYRFHIVEYNVRQKFADIRTVIEGQRRYLFSRFGEQLLRPYFENFYRPLRKRQIKSKTMKILHRNFVIAELHDLVMFAVYIILLYVVILAGKDSLIVRSKTAMTEVAEGVFTRTTNFHRIETSYDIYTYINETLIPSIHPLRWYGNFVVSEPGLMVDVVDKCIGVVRFRQQRMKKKLCEVPPLMQFLNMTCLPEFAIPYTETGTFGYKWGNFSSYMIYDRLVNIWRYYHEKDTKTFPSVGQFAAYSGGGYVAYLGRTLYNSYANFRQILYKLWIDHATRVIFIEFFTYNVDNNVFNSVRLIFEQSATGLISAAVIVYTVRMIFVNNEVEMISVVFFNLFVIWVLLLFLKYSLGVIKNLRTFYKDVWVMIDLVILVTSVMCIVLYSLRLKFIGEYLKKMETARNNEFLSYFYLFYIEDFMTLVAAFLVCIATARLWKFLRFAKMFRIMERTLSIAASSFFTFFFAFLIMMTGFSLTLLLLLGNDFHRVHSVVKTLRLMLTMALKPTEMNLYEYIGYKIATLYMLTYMIAILISLFTFIMIIVGAYTQAQLEFSAEVDIYNITDYIVERAKYLLKFCKYKTKRLKGGLRKNIKVVPKSYKFLHFNSYSVSSPRMHIMENLTQCTLRQQDRKKSVLSERDLKMMTSISRLFFLKDTGTSREIFFRGKIRGKKIQLVDMKNIEKMANIVNLLLQEELILSSVEKKKNLILLKYIQAIKKKQNSLRRCEWILKMTLHQMTAAELNLSKLS